MTISVEALGFAAVFLQTATETAVENATNGTAEPTVPADTPESDATLGILTVTVILLAYWAVLAFVFGWLRVFIGRRGDEVGKTPSERRMFREVQKEMLTEIPWNQLKRATEYIRREFYTKPWPTDKPALVVTESPAEVESALRNEAFFEGSPYSYDYENADLDLRRPHGTDDAGVPMEIHVRGRSRRGGDATELIAHIEYSRYEAKELHIEAESESLRWDEARDEMMHILVAVTDGEARRLAD